MQGSSLSKFGWGRLLGGVALGALLLALVVPGVSRPRSAIAAAETDERVLDVSGTGIIEVKPDTARITLGVSTLAAGAAESYNQAAAAMNAVITALKAMGIEGDNIGTSGLNLGTEYEWAKDRQVLKGYRTNVNIHVTLTDLTQVGPVVDKAVASGANSLQGVQFLVKNTAQHLNAALDAAVDDARAQADRVAARLGTAVTGVERVSIITHDDARPPAPVFMAREAAMGADAYSMPIMAGTAEYRATVLVVFKLAPSK